MWKAYQNEKSVVGHCFDDGSAGVPQEFLRTLPAPRQIRWVRAGERDMINLGARARRTRRGLRWGNARAHAAVVAADDHVDAVKPATQLPGGLGVVASGVVRSARSKRRCTAGDALLRDAMLAELFEGEVADDGGNAVPGDGADEQRWNVFDGHYLVVARLREGLGDAAGGTARLGGAGSVGHGVRRLLQDVRLQSKVLLRGRAMLREGQLERDRGGAVSCALVVESAKVLLLREVDGKLWQSVVR